MSTPEDAVRHLPIPAEVTVYALGIFAAGQILAPAAIRRLGARAYTRLSVALNALAFVAAWETQPQQSRSSLPLPPCGRAHFRSVVLPKEECAQ